MTSTTLRPSITTQPTTTQPPRLSTAQQQKTNTLAQDNTKLSTNSRPTIPNIPATLTPHEINTINIELLPNSAQNTTRIPLEKRPRFEQIQMLPMNTGGALQPANPTKVQPLRIVNHPPANSGASSNFVQWPQDGPAQTHPKVTFPPNLLSQITTTSGRPSFWDNWSPNKEVATGLEQDQSHSHFDLSIRTTTVEPLDTFQPKPQRPPPFATASPIHPIIPNQSNTSASGILTDNWLLEILEEARNNATKPPGLAVRPTSPSIVGNQFFPPVRSIPTR